MKTWDDVDDIIFDGSKEEVDNLKCVDCSNNLDVSFDKEAMSLTIRCTKCGKLIREHGCSYIPSYLNK